MKWVGLTGGLGTGKTTVASIIRKQGYPVFDADEVARHVVRAGSPGLKSVVDQFGPQFLNSAGELDRQKMADFVFSDPEKLKKLEALIHPLVQAEVSKLKSEAEKSGIDLAFYDVPLLFEKKLSGFDAVVVVTASLETQKLRLKNRNNWTDQEIEKRIKSQVALSEKIAGADFVINNDGALENLAKNVLKLIEQLKGFKKS